MNFFFHSPRRLFLAGLGSLVVCPLRAQEQKTGKVKKDEKKSSSDSTGQKSKKSRNKKRIRLKRRTIKEEEAPRKPGAPPKKSPSRDSVEAEKRSRKTGRPKPTPR